MVGATGIEPVTPSMSTHRHAYSSSSQLSQKKRDFRLALHGEDRRVVHANTESLVPSF